MQDEENENHFPRFAQPAVSMIGETMMQQRCVTDRYRSVMQTLKNHH
jgi:hypothetical protein